VTSDTSQADQAWADLDSPVGLTPLSYLEEGSEVTVGRPDTGSYCILPPDGAALLRRLQGGTSPRQAAVWYLAEYGDPVDIVEFLLAMSELGFVTTDPEPVSTGGRRYTGRGAHRHRRSCVRWQRLGAAAFSPLAWVLYGAIMLAAVIAMVRQPELAPHYEQLFFSPYLTVMELVLVFGQIPLLLFHESFHALGGRRLGLPSTFHVGRRLYYIVVETSLDGLVGVPRGKRYLPMLAGMLADLLVISILTLIAGSVGSSGNDFSLLAGVCLALAFGTLLRFVWQFYFFLHTDLYYVVSTAMRCVNLQRTARQMLGNRARRLLGRRDLLVDETSWHPRDRAVARWYSWLLLVGYTVAIAVIPLVAIPTMLKVARSVWDNLAGDHSAVGTVDGIAFLAVNAAQVALLVTLIHRDRRRRRVASAHLID